MKKINGVETEQTVIRQKILSVIGQRDGWGRACWSSGYSHLVELGCGHREWVPNSRYRGIGSRVRCSDCEELRYRKMTGIVVRG